MVPQRFRFDLDTLTAVAGGRSAIDIPKLRIHTLEAAESFIHSYGYKITSAKDVERLWYFHRRAHVLLTEKLGFSESEIPDEIKDRKKLGDIRKLLLFASLEESADKNIQKWACAYLRAMHVFVHSETDLFNSFSEEIQNQVLQPIEKAIFHDGANHKVFLKSQNEGKDPIPLLGFEVKPFKTSTSSVIKLLAKPDAIAMRIFDKLGVRFITNSVFDSFQVIRFLAEEHIISFPHIMPDQSSNNIFPVDLFVQVCQELALDGQSYTEIEMNQIFTERLISLGSDVQHLRKENLFSGSDYRFIKFIARKKVDIEREGMEGFSFFYPFEVQIMDEASRRNILSGPSEHQAYKKRQEMAARKRLFPEGEPDSLPS